MKGIINNMPKSAVAVMLPVEYKPRTLLRAQTFIMPPKEQQVELPEIQLKPLPLKRSNSHLALPAPDAINAESSNSNQTKAAPIKDSTGTNDSGKQLERIDTGF